MKKQIAIGDGEMLDTFANTMVPKKHVPAYIKKLRENQSKFSDTSASKAWKYVYKVASDELYT